MDVLLLPREESSPHGPAFGGSFPLSRNRADIFSGFIVGGARRVLLTNVPTPLSRGTKGVVWTVNHNYMYIVQSSEINVRHQRWKRYGLDTGYSNHGDRWTHKK